MRALLIIILSLLVSMVSYANDDYWVGSVSDFIATGGQAHLSVAADRISVLRAGETAYYRQIDSETNDSKVLDVSNCGSFTALWHGTSGGVGLAFLMDNVSPSTDGEPDTVDSVKILNQEGDVALDGDTVGRKYINNVAGINWIWVDITVDPGDATQSTMRITCHPATRW